MQSGMQNERTNQFYLKENKVNEPKDYFKLLLEDLRQTAELESIEAVCDIGCAAGDFLYFVKQELTAEYPDKVIKYTGIDTLDQLIKAAEEKVPEGEFLLADINQAEALEDMNESFDVVSMMGVIYLFEDFRISLKNAINLLKPGGCAYILSSFNRYGFDVNLSYRSISNPQLGEGNMHIFSIHEISDWLNQCEGLKYEWIPFQLKTEIVQKPDNYLRAWTVELSDGSLGQIDGLNRYREQFFLKVVRGRKNG